MSIIKFNLHILSKRSNAKPDYSFKETKFEENVKY